MKLLNFIRGRRSKKELLSLVLIDGEKHPASGICYVCARLLAGGEISLREYLYLLNFIKNNRPKPGSKHFDESMRCRAYYWPENQWEPRKAWLEDQIKKY